MNTFPFDGGDAAAAHPRPDFRRADRQSLDGAWEFAFDPEDRGEAERWQGPGGPFPDRILVPFPWEAPAAWGEAPRAGDSHFSSERAYRQPPQGPGEPVLRGPWHDARNAATRQRIGWYRRTFVLRPDWQDGDRRVFVVVGAADWEATVFCNGIRVGSHVGGYTPFSVELTGVLRPAGEENVLVLRVADPGDPDQPGGKQHWWYERTSGIWQSVYLESRPEGHLTHLRVIPDVAGKRARVEVGLCPVAGNFHIRVSARSPEGEVFSAEVVCPGCERRQVELPLGPHPALWSPDQPHLYDLTVEVAAPAAGARAVDVVHSYFGLREVAIGTLPDSDLPCIHLNGRPLYLRTALHQSFHPAGIYAHPDGATIRADLEAARAAGLNGLRIHIKVDDPRVYYWADRLGLAILYDLPNTGRQSPAARAHWEAVLRAAVERDANHPSVLLWVLFNETWGLGSREGYRADPDTQAWVERMVELTRRLDPTRLVEDNSPCHFDHVTTDVNSWHFYINDYARAKAHIATAVEGARPGSPWNFVPGRVQGRVPLLCSEYGGIGAGDGDRDVSFCLKWLTNELRLHERIAGYVYTELTDLEWEHNGLLRYGRLPKEFPYDLRDVFGADALALDAPPIQRLAPGATCRLPACAAIFSGLASGHGSVRWAVEGTDAMGRHVHGGRGEAPAAWTAYRVTALGELAVPIPDRPGVYRLSLALYDAAGRRVCGTYAEVVAGEALHAMPELTTSGFAATHRRGDYFVGEGPGLVRFRLPRTGPRLVLEAAAGVFEPRQTDPERTPSHATLRVNGQVVGEIRLPDAPADARGVLSYAAGIPGAYGYLLSAPVPAGGGDTLEVEIAAGAGGLALFGPAAGRYLLGPQAV